MFSAILLFENFPMIFSKNITLDDKMRTEEKKSSRSTKKTSVMFFSPDCFHSNSVNFGCNLMTEFFNTNL